MKPSTRRRTTRLGHLITNVDLSQHDIDPTRIWMAAVAAMALEAAGQIGGSMTLEGLTSTSRRITGEHQE